MITYFNVYVVLSVTDCSLNTFTQSIIIISMLCVLYYTVEARILGIRTEGIIMGCLSSRSEVKIICESYGFPVPTVEFTKDGAPIVLDERYIYRYRILYCDLAICMRYSVVFSNCSYSTPTE